MNNVILKTRSDATRTTPTLITLDQADLVQRTTEQLRLVAPDTNFRIVTASRDKSHTKAAHAYGGGETYRHTFRSDKSVIVNGDTLFPQVTIVDRTFSGASLRVFIGFFRLVCSNGLVIPAGEATKLAIPHRISSTEQMKQLSYSIAAAWDSVTAAQEKLTAAASVAVDASRIIQQLDMFSEAQRADLIRGLNWFIRREDNPNNAAGLYQYVNEFDRRGARRNSTAHLDRDVNMLDTILTLAAA
jgi:hypothetical protein